jgi:hypothetical protein
MGADGRIRNKGQAAAEQVLQNHDNTQHWVDPTLGMTQCQKEEYECQQAAQAKSASLDWNYNFNEEHLINPTAGRADDGMAFTLTRNISHGDTAYDVVAADNDEEDLKDILAKPYDDKEEGCNRMEIQMNQAHHNMGQHRTHTSLLLSGEEFKRRASSKESLASGNGSRGEGPGWNALTSELARSTLQANEIMPAQDQAPIPSGSKGLAPEMV